MRLRKVTKRVYTAEYGCGCVITVRLTKFACRLPRCCQWHDKYTFRITDERTTVFDVLDDKGGVAKRHKS